MKAYAESGYQSKINNERVGGHQAGWGAYGCPLAHALTACSQSKGCIRTAADHRSRIAK